MKRLIISIILNILCLSSYCYSWDGIGTEDQPYLISTSQHLVELAEEVNNGTDFHDEFFRLTNDIDLSDVCGDSLGDWVPIGSITNYFEGILLGNNHTISNLYFNVKGNSTYYGLFGHVGERGAIYDLTIENGSVYSTFWCGGIVASNSGLISNCKNINCNVDSWHFSGGICGVNLNTITNCTNQAEVSSSLCSGGICAYNYGIITKCTNKNRITANEGCGGICGYNGGFADFTNCNNVKIGFIDNCNNNFTILGDEKIGGIAGRNDGFIVNSMNNGTINGDQQVGGLVGYNGGFDGVIGNISNSYNTGTVMGRDTLTGGIVGYGNQASEIYNVYTTDYIRCVSQPTIDYIGENDGVKENCFIINHNVETTTYDSTVNQLNQWITLQPNQNSYIKWGINNDSLYSIIQSNFTKQDTTSSDHTNVPLYNKSQDDIKIYSVNGNLYIISPARQSVGVYSVDGKAVRKIDLLSNAMTRIRLEKGVYIINGHKVVVY